MKKLTNDQIQKKLNKLAELSNELDEEAKRRYYGPKGFLFFEADGHFHMMDGDDCPDFGSGDRQSHVRFSSKIYTSMQSGVW